MRSAAWPARACALALLAGFPGVTAGEELPTLSVGHVGHDHQLALYVAADAGAALEERYGVGLRPLKDREVYELVDGGKPVAVVRLLKVGGGSGMPAAMEQGDIEVGLGGLGPVAKFADRGAPLKVLAPLNNDGDALVLRPDTGAASWPEFVALARRAGKPLRVGYKAPNAVAFMILIKALDAEGLRWGPEPLDKEGRPVNVVVVNLQDDQNLLPAMEAGTVDGVVANEPYPSLLVFKGLGRRAADLSALPPPDVWKGHPCCVVAAAEKTLREKRAAVVSLLKVIVAGTDLMAVDPEAAYRAEARWTKTPPEVGRLSIPNVSFVQRPDERWLTAVRTWVGLMQSMNLFDKGFKAGSPEDVSAQLLELGPIAEAIAALEPRLRK